MALLVLASIGGLPEPQRLVLLLRYLDDLSRSEIAGVLRVPLSQVDYLRTLGIRGVRAELDPNREQLRVERSATVRRVWRGERRRTQLVGG